MNRERRIMSSNRAPRSHARNLSEDALKSHARNLSEDTLKSHMRNLSNLSEDTLKLFGDDESTAFDLGENYQSAVDCLIQCECIIKSLQEQLAVKDEQLVAKDERIERLEGQLSRESARSNANHGERRMRQQLAAKDERIRSLEAHAEGLEEKLITMSMELASSMADHDRHQQEINGLKRRISGNVSNADDDDEEEEEMERTERSRRQSSWQPTTIKKKYYTPAGKRAASARRRRGSWSGRDSLTSSSEREESLRSWSGREEVPTAWSGIDTTAWPSQDSGEVPPAKKQASFSSEGAENPHLLSFKKAGRLACLAQRMSWKIDDTPSSSSFLDTSEKSMADARLDDSGKASEDSASLHDSHNSLSSRRLSTIGQFLLGLNGKGGNDKAVEVVARAIATGHNSKANATNVPAMDNYSSLRSGRSAPSPDRERLSCVIFPVSSDDCLVGLCQDADAGEEARERRDLRRCTSNW